MRAWVVSATGAFLVLFGMQASALVTTPVGGRPKELDINVQATAERGKIEPNENEASWVPARDFYEYKIGVGYTWGHYGPLEFFSTRLEATYYQSPQEKNDPDEWIVQAPGTGTSPVLGAGECGSGAKYLGGGVCEFYPEDDGALLSATVSAAVIHDPRFALGVFFRGTVPIGMNLEKFANPRIDYFAFGTQAGVELLDWLLYESTIFLGLGTRPFGDEQNGALALSSFFHFKARRWLLPWKAGVKVGPYVEGDIHERFDERYDRAYSPIVLPQAGAPEEQHRDRIRAARFAVALLPYFLVTEQLAVELGYVQKFFGYDARATQVWFVGVRGLVRVGE